MKKSDVGVLAFIYAICALFYYLTFELPPEAQTYPLVLIAALFALTTLYLVLQLKGLLSKGFINDLPEVFNGFLVKQFAGVCLLAILYIVGIYVAGFYIATIVFLLVTMLFLKVPKISMISTVVVLGLIIYLVFSTFLKVPLPAGLLFE